MSGKKSEQSYSLGIRLVKIGDRVPGDITPLFFKVKVNFPESRIIGESDKCAALFTYSIMAAVFYPNVS